MKALLLTLFLFTATTCFAQKDVYPVTAEALTDKITTLDAEAFEYFNTCNLAKFRTFFTEDLEFYHDKGGLNKGIDIFLETIQKNICNNPDGKVIRKPVKGSFKVYPLEGYGAILTGDHDFYIIINGTEKKTGTAKFTHVWLLNDGYWRMARILSYEHHGIE